MGTRAPTRERIRIDDLLLDPGRHELNRDGATIELPRLSYQLLPASSIAALSCSNWSGDPADDYFSAGLANELQDHGGGRRACAS